MASKCTVRIVWFWTARLALCCLALPTLAQRAFGGNIVITGHDDDFHASGCATPSPASVQLSAMIAFARSGAPSPSLPVLSFDHGQNLTSCLQALGIAFINVDPDGQVPAASFFDAMKYSAMVVASDSSCGGCDNTALSTQHLEAASPAIGAFLNRGGGIVAFAGGGNAASYYGFLPASASGFGSPPPAGYIQTGFGAMTGIPAVDGNPTHNFFPNPGTGGVSGVYDVVEALSVEGTAETLACRDCTTTGLIAGTLLEPAGPIGGLVAVAMGVVFLKKARAADERNRPRKMEDGGFSMRIGGAIVDGEHSSYDLDVRGTRDAQCGRQEWDA